MKKGGEVVGILFALILYSLGIALTHGGKPYGYGGRTQQNQYSHVTLRCQRSLVYIVLRITSHCFHLYGAFLI